MVFSKKFQRPFYPFWFFAVPVLRKIDLLLQFSTYRHAVHGILLPTKLSTNSWNIFLNFCLKNFSRLFKVKFFFCGEPNIDLSPNHKVSCKTPEELVRLNSQVEQNSYSTFISRGEFILPPGIKAGVPGLISGQAAASEEEQVCWVDEPGLDTSVP